MKRRTVALFAVVVAHASMCHADLAYSGLSNLVTQAEVIVVGQVVEQRSVLLPLTGTASNVSRVVTEQTIYGTVPTNGLWVSWLEDCPGHLGLKVGSRAVFFLSKGKENYGAVNFEEGVKHIEAANGGVLRKHQFAREGAVWEGARVKDFVKHLKTMVKKKRKTPQQDKSSVRDKTQSLIPEPKLSILLIRKTEAMPSLPSQPPVAVDAQAGTSLYLNDNAQILTAKSKDGKTLWSADIIKECGVPAVGKPRVRSVTVQDGKAKVVFGKHDFATVDLKSGEIECQGAD